MSDNRIKELSESIWKLHDFSYRTLRDAKMTVTIGKYKYCFDALSLCMYSTNLSYAQQNELNAYLNKFYNDQSSEDRKKQNEYSTLFKYLTTPHNLFREYNISKEEQPDFLLSGMKKIGIEVVEFTTEKDAILRDISRRNFGQGKSAEEIHQAAINKHGSKAENYNYLYLGDTAAIGIKELLDLDELFALYSKLIYGKHEKYKKMFSEFDEFIVLCEARNTLVSEQRNADDIIAWARELGELKGFTVCILYNGNNGLELATYKL